jgi:transposase
VASDSVVLSDSQQLELNRITQSRSLPAGYAFRARLILMLAEGASFEIIKQRLGTTAPTIVRWKQRFLASGIDGLDTSHPGQPAFVLTPKLRAQILPYTRRKPKDGSPHWSSRKLEAELGVSKDAVHRVRKEAGMKPHRLERYMDSDDPDFETKAAGIIGLYLNPPQPAAVFCVDGKTAIQALDGSILSCPFARPRRATRIRILPSWNAFSVYGAGHGHWPRSRQDSALHISQDFVAFLNEVVALCPSHQQIHIILDNPSAPKTALVRDFLEQNPRVRFHYTPPTRRG